MPFLWKDIGAVTAGMPLWLGNRVLKDIDYRAPADTVLGSRLRDAGFIVLGKTNIPELGSTPTTQPLSCGPTANPWDPERSPAGSSGGSAAAVAAGLVAIAHASDGGGSIRIPASWCGLVGLKTTRGRNPYPETISRLTAELAVTRTVRDTAALLDAVHGHTDADLYAIAPPERPYVDEVGRPVERMRIGLLTDGGGIAIDAECVTAAEQIAAVLEADGHAVETVDPDVLFGGDDATTNGVLWMAGLTRRVDAMGELVGRPLTADEVEPYNWTAAERGRTMTAAEWTRAQERQQAVEPPRGRRARGLRPPDHADHRHPAAHHRRARAADREAVEGRRPLRQDRPLHAAVQRDRTPGHLTAARPDEHRASPWACSSSRRWVARTDSSASRPGSRPRARGPTAARRSTPDAEPALSAAADPLLDGRDHGLHAARLERPAGVVAVVLEEVLDQERRLGLELGPGLRGRLDRDRVRVDRDGGRADLEQALGQHVGRTVTLLRGPLGRRVPLDRHARERAVEIEHPHGRRRALACGHRDRLAHGARD